MNAFAPVRGPVNWVIGIGELLWDLLPAGPRLGGAPFNATAHLAGLGYAAAYVTSVGDDALGCAAVAAAEDLRVVTRFIRTIDVPTGVARVELDAEGSPRFEISSPAAYEVMELSPAEVVEIACLRPGAIIFGTLAQRSPSVHAVTGSLVEAIPTALRVYDVNLREDRWDVSLVAGLMDRATVAKFNADEMAVLAPAFDAPSSPVQEFCAAVAARFGLSVVCVTRGALGACLWVDGGYFEEPAVPVHVVDTVGAGDAFTAALVDGLLRRDDPHATLRRANTLGAFVAARPGAVLEQ